ncbi:MAG: sulfur carrier protein ThiS [Candidatus Omnitrophota bacterium]|nr:MAG: sulfur carrier protein ThiS [Candidatus Omnitrophota bacterium]
MFIKINGVKSESNRYLTVADLVSDKKFNPKTIVIELNRDIIDPKDWPKTVLKEGDSLEIISFVGGG